jgi:hypothetical protein
MKDMHLWLKAVKDRLETVRVSGQKDVSTMAAVLNTLDDLMGKAKQEAEQDEANNQQE